MTHLGSSLRIDGDISSDEDLAVHGQVRGRIVVPGQTLVIAHSAHIDAELRGARVIVHGRVNGPITASERIELGPSATATGSLSANHVVLADGTRFQGRIDMDKRTIAARLSSYRSAHSA